MAAPLISQLVEDDEEKAAQEHIEDIRKKLGEAQKVDLAFLLDATGSMGPSIKGVKEKIVDIVEGVKGAFPKDGELRFACAFYRDYDVDEDPRYERSGICCGFTCDVREFQKKLEGLEPRGGDDDAEDVFSGLERLLELKWTAPATRLVYHIADAPCHGRRFHDPQYIANPKLDTAFTLERFRSVGATSEDDPEGRKIEEILRRLGADAKISTYTFLHIHRRGKGERPTTSKMLEEFKKANENNELSRVEMVEHVVQMLADGRGPTAMRALAELLLEVVGNGVKSNVNSRMNDIVNKPSLPRSTTLLPEMLVDAAPPTNWSTLLIHKVLIYRSTKYDSLGEMLTQIEQGLPLGFRANAKEPIHMRIAEQPFTPTCATRWPYYAQIQVLQNSWKPFVIKRFKYVDKASLEHSLDPCKSLYLDVMETHAIASKCASHFYAEIKNEKALDRAKEVYLDSPLTTCKVAGRPGDCFTLERLHSNAQWIKVDEKSDYYETLQALSHWTHVYSEHFLMVIVDKLILEGQTLDKAPQALICDPTIHSEKYPRRFKRTNKREVGIQFFYDNHKCNDLCKVLGL